MVARRSRWSHTGQMGRNPMDAVTFARSALGNFRQTASVVPSSRRLARAMVDPVACLRPKVVLEFGPGTGAMTRELLRRLPSDTRLLAFEINPRFVVHLWETIPDRRVRFVPAGAETAARELDRRGISTVDAVVSSLSLGMMAVELADSIFRGIAPYLEASSRVTQYQYVHRTRVDGGKFSRFDARAMLRRHFSSVRSTTVWLNIPPAVVSTCAGVRETGRPTLG